MPASDNHKFVYIDEERSLLADVKDLAGRAGRRFTRGAEDAVLTFARHYGFPAMPDATMSGYRLSLATIREELLLFGNFERLQEKVRNEVARHTGDGSVSVETRRNGVRLGEEVARYLDNHGVRVVFEISESLSLTPRIFSGPPITSAVGRLVISWESDSGLAPRLCACGCGQVFTPRRTDQECINAAHRKRRSRQGV